MPGQTDKLFFEDIFGNKMSERAYKEPAKIHVCYFGLLINLIFPFEYYGKLFEVSAMNEYAAREGQG